MAKPSQAIVQVWRRFSSADIGHIPAHDHVADVASVHVIQRHRQGLYEVIAIGDLGPGVLVLMGVGEQGQNCLARRLVGTITEDRVGQQAPFLLAAKHGHAGLPFLLLEKLLVDGDIQIAATERVYPVDEMLDFFGEISHKVPASVFVIVTNDKAGQFLKKAGERGGGVVDDKEPVRLQTERRGAQHQAWQVRRLEQVTSPGIVRAYSAAASAYDAANIEAERDDGNDGNGWGV